MSKHLSVVDFLSALAARQPTPGGGSASALAGALGVALGSMSALYTSGNEKFKAVEAKALDFDRRFAALRESLLQLMQLDIEAYAGYSAARALPKESAEQKAQRKRAMADANEKATRVPEQIVAECVEGLKLLEELGGIVNPNLAGDVAVAAYFMEAAARGAGIQVLGNCASDDTEGVNAARRAAVSERIAQCQAARERIDTTVRKLLNLK